MPDWNPAGFAGTAGIAGAPRAVPHAPLLSLLAAMALLAGCTTAGVPAIAPSGEPPPPPPPPGMERLLYQPPARAIALLGPPRMDKIEGEARQLQFSGACILDVWYYPRPPATSLLATYADARLPDGNAIPAADCLNRLLPKAGEEPDPMPAQGGAAGNAGNEALPSAEGTAAPGGPTPRSAPRNGERRGER